MNKGAKALRKELGTEKGAALALALEVDAFPSTVSRWLTGKRLPVLSMRYTLEDLYGISPRLWDKQVKP